MGIDVKIRNKRFIKKPLKIEDIAGIYNYGHADDYYRFEEGLVTGTNIVYDPQHIGRGFEFEWTGDDKDEISLRLNFLTTIYDIRIFYETVRNIMQLWGAKEFQVDDGVFEYNDIAELEDNALRDNAKYLMMQRMMAERTRNVMILGAMNPLCLSCEEVAGYGERGDLEGFARRLHELQNVDLYYAVPKIYKLNNDTYFGSFVITTDTDSILPIEAVTPPFFTDPNTGETIKCAFFALSLVSIEKGGLVGRMAFENFAREIDIQSLPRYDEEHVILKGLSEERIAELAAKGYEDPVEKFCE